MFTKTTPKNYPDAKIRPLLNGSETGNVISHAKSILIGIRGVQKKPIAKIDRRSNEKFSKISIPI